MKIKLNSDNSISFWLKRINSDNNLFENLIFSFFQILNKHMEDQVDN